MEVELMPDRSWVVLIANTYGEYEQDGPYTAREVLIKIASGQLDYSDRVWRPGFQTWSRIGDLSAFVPSTLLDSEQKTQSQEIENNKRLLSEESEEELLQSVAQLEGKDLLEYAPEAKPFEAEGEDLTRQKTARFQKEPSIDEINQMSFPLENKQAAAAQVSEEVSKKWIPENLRVRGLVSNLKNNFSRFFAVAVLLLLVGFLLKHFVVIEPTTSLEAKEKSLSAIQKKSLRLYGVALNSLRPRLEVRSNYDREDQLSLTVIGREGRILNHYRFRTEKKYSFIPGETLDISLSSLNLSDGLYTIKASLGNLRAEKEVFIGVDDIQFESKLKQFNSQKRKRSELEEKIIDSVAKDLENRAGELVEKMNKSKMTDVEWKSFYNSWKRKFYDSAHSELRSFSRETAEKFVNVDQFRSLKESRLELWKISKDLGPKVKEEERKKITKLRDEFRSM